MIIIRILGGLGNQMFQYAAAKALAEKNNTQIKADVTGFENYDLRNFELDKLRTGLTIAPVEEIADHKAINTFQRIKARLTPYKNKKFYKEPFFHYDEKFMQLGSDVYIQGYFQSEKYFLQTREKITREFTAREDFSNDITDFAANLKTHQSVAIHIRKGDYKNAEALDVHGLLDNTYYENAISHIKSKIPDARFYLFSDDVTLAKKELSFDSLKIVSGEISNNHLEDLFLMSQCKHNIIANSSFSWWGAWLNNNLSKIVVAPKNWFNKGPKDIEDLIPPSWIKL